MQLYQSNSKCLLYLDNIGVEIEIVPEVLVEVLQLSAHVHLGHGDHALDADLVLLHGGDDVGQFVAGAVLDLMG